jgi:hypothetical protein
MHNHDISNMKSELLISTRDGSIYDQNRGIHAPRYVLYTCTYMCKISMYIITYFNRHMHCIHVYTCMTLIYT